MPECRIILRKTYSKLTIRICFVVASGCMLVGNALAVNVWGIIVSSLFLIGNALALIEYFKK